MDALERIKKAVDENPVIIFMKGSPQMPSCGFSSRAAQALMQCEQPFAYVNILEDPDIFHNLPQFANWPTFPQLYIEGELVGGCDITLEMYDNGDLKKMVTAANEKNAAAKNDANNEDSAA